MMTLPRHLLLITPEDGGPVGEEHVRAVAIAYDEMTRLDDDLLTLLRQQLARCSRAATAEWASTGMTN